MRFAPLLLSLAVLSIAVTSAAASEPEPIDASDSARPVATAPGSPGAAAAGVQPPVSGLPEFWGSAYPYHSVLKRYTFDNGASPDPQGWTTHDLTVQDGTFWHIDDFVGLAEPYTPISGAKSMWCGLASDPGYELLPGYGNRWTQILESNVFSVGIYEPVYIEYAIKYDFAGADRVDLEYRSAITGWKPLATYSGTDLTGATVQSYVPTVDVFQTIQFRFVMTSGIYNSDEDFTNTMGAVILDDPLVYHGNPPILVGFDSSTATRTEAPIPSNGTHPRRRPSATTRDWYPAQVWSGRDREHLRTCGRSSMARARRTPAGYPAQAAVPKTASPGSTRLTDYLCNEVRSPSSICPSTSTTSREFRLRSNRFRVRRVQRSSGATNKVMYSMRTRFMVGGVPEPWLSPGYVFYTNTAQWFHWDTSSFHSFHSSRRDARADRAHRDRQRLLHGRHRDVPLAIAAFRQRDDSSVVFAALRYQYR
jgi:hypothetical protein